MEELKTDLTVHESKKIGRFMRQTTKSVEEISFFLSNSGFEGLAVLEGLLCHRSFGVRFFAADHLLLVSNPASEFFVPLAENINPDAKACLWKIAIEAPNLLSLESMVRFRGQVVELGRLRDEFLKQRGKFLRD